MAYGRQFEITVNCTDGETIHITDVDVDFRLCVTMKKSRTKLT